MLHGFQEAKGKSLFPLPGTPRDSYREASCNLYNLCYSYSSYAYETLDPLTADDEELLELPELLDVPDEELLVLPELLVLVGVGVAFEELPVPRLLPPVCFKVFLLLL